MKVWTYLKISGNNIYGLFTELVKDLDWKMPSLYHLVMEHTGLGEEDIQALASLLHEQLPSLHYIYLGYDISNLQGYSDETLTALKAIESGCELDIYEGHCFLDGEQVKKILEEEEERRRSTDA